MNIRKRFDEVYGMEMTKFSMEYFCEKKNFNVRYTKCVTMGCGDYVNIGKDDLFPGREIGLDIDEFLVFYFKCPKCGTVHMIENELIPLSIQRELVIKYAGIIDKYSKKVLLEQERSILMARVREIDNNMKELEEAIDIIEEESCKKVPEYQKRLYHNWKTVEELFSGK